MAQAKVLYVVLAAGELRMSELAARLGVSSRTASGLVDRLVELGLLSRHDDPADRRQVVVATTPEAVALLERFRELNQRQLRELLGPPRRRGAGRRRAARSTSSASPSTAPSTRHRSNRRHQPEPGEPAMSRLSQLAVSKRSVTLLFAAAIFVAGISAWGSLKQELLPDIEFPVVTVVTPYPGAGSSDVPEQVTRPIERAVGAVPGSSSSSRPPSNSISLVVTQFAFGTDVPKDDGRASRTRSARRRCRTRPRRRSRRSTSTPRRSSSRRSPRPAPTGSSGRRRSPGARSSRRSGAIEGVARADLTGGLESRLAVTLDPAKLAASGISTQQIVGVLGANNLTLPSGQLPADGTRTPVSTIGRLTPEARSSSSSWACTGAAAERPPPR